MNSIKYIADNIAKWEATSLRENILNVSTEMDNRKSPSHSPKGIIWSCSNSINPYEMYTYLKARFGRANGVQMILKKAGTADNLTHWEYQIQLEAHTITFTGFVFHFNIFINLIKNENDDDQAYFLSAIRSDFESYKNELSQIRNKLEKWNLFINPYYHLSEMIDDNFSLLKSLELSPPFVDRPKDIEKFSTINEANKSMHQAFCTGTTLKIFIPIWIESFISLVLFVFTKVEIKCNEKEFKKIRRLNIIDRILKLSEVCDIFKEELLLDELNNIKKVFQNRNRILHGAIDPKTTSKETIFFDERYTPLFNRHTYGPGLIQNILLNEIKVKDIEAEITIGENFISLVIGKMKSEYSILFIEMMNEHVLAWNSKQYMAGSVLPPFVDLFHKMPT